MTLILQCIWLLVKKNNKKNNINKIKAKEKGWMSKVYLKLIYSELFDSGKKQNG